MTKAWYRPLLERPIRVIPTLRKNFPNAKFLIDSQKVSKGKLVRKVRWVAKGKKIAEAVVILDYTPEVKEWATRNPRQPLGVMIKRKKLKAKRVGFTSKGNKRAFRFLGEVEGTVRERFY